MKNFLAEMKKTKGKWMWGAPLGIFLVDFAWLYWVFSDLGAEELADGYYQLLMNLPLVNTITLPILAAVLASRLCDMENKGNTYKLLCTLQEKGVIFCNKFLLGSLYIVFFALMQLGLVVFLGWRYRIPQELETDQMAYLFLSTCATTIVLFLLQEILSLMMDNQLYPLFIGLIGTFAGLFSWFFPHLPLRYIIPWGYYCVGCTINNIYYEETREVFFYTIPFSYGGLAALLCFAAVLYIYGRNLFLKKEV